MDLSGTWRAIPADDELRRTATGLDVDDDSWEPITVPGHWRSTPAFAELDGPLLYRRGFSYDAGPPDRRHWLHLDGVFYQGDVWLDGVYLGDPEGYFFPHEYEITDLARLAPDHSLAVEVTCSPQRDKAAKRNITGVFQHWDGIDPAFNPGGLWRPVHIASSGAVRIARLRVLSREADTERAVLSFRAELDTREARTVHIRTQVGTGEERVQEQSLAAGVNRVVWTHTVEDPDLWWPWSLGDPALTDVRVTVDVDGEVSDERLVRTGLREVSMRNWVLTVNGERLFLKGANVGPTRAALAEAAPADLGRDVALARDAGLDLIRVHGHISRPELYDAADELGMLVWQDFPLQWGYARGIRRAATKQVREAVDVLGHHPSIALWCGHNEPFTIEAGRGAPAEFRRRVSRLAVRHELPSWNKTVLDGAVKRAFERADETRPVVAHSGVAPHPPQFDGTDSHLYFGWYHGDERDLPSFAATLPRMVRFVSEFGAQAVPDTADFLQPGRWPDLDWDHLSEHHGLQQEIFAERVPPERYATFSEWQAATQRYQSVIVKHHVETLRRLKYRPTGGFCVFMLADAMPAVSWALLDHQRVPKRAWTALVDACRPVIVVADRLPQVVHPGDTLALDVHVVSDLHRPLRGGVVTARLSWEGGNHSWRWGGDVPADDCLRIGTISAVVPDAQGELTLLLDFVAGDDIASNRYRAVIAPR